MGQEEPCPTGGSPLMGWYCFFLKSTKWSYKVFRRVFRETQFIFRIKGVTLCLEDLHERFVVATADKASNNILPKKNLS